MAIICLRKMPTLPLFLLLVCLAISVCDGERCEVLCNIDALRDQCERCKLRIPMRFGKRSSPPEALLDFAALASPQSDHDLNSLENADDVNSQFLQFLSNALQHFPENDLLKEDSKPRKNNNAQLNWMDSRLPLTIVRRKRTLTSHMPSMKDPPASGRLVLPKSPYFLLNSIPSVHYNVPRSTTV